MGGVQDLAMITGNTSRQVSGSMRMLIFHMVRLHVPYPVMVSILSIKNVFVMIFVVRNIVLYV